MEAQEGHYWNHTFGERFSNGGVKNVGISKDVLNSCKGAYRKYELDLHNKKKLLEEEEAASKAAKEASAREAEKNAKRKRKNLKEKGI